MSGCGASTVGEAIGRETPDVSPSRRSRLSPMTAHLHDAGFAPGAEARMSKGERAAAAVRNRANLSAVANVHKENLPQLPEEFVSQAMARIAPHISTGNFNQAIDTIHALASEWEIQQEEQRQSEANPHAATLAIHVSHLFPVRTANLIETVCAGTVGSLLECFPDSFVGLPNCGLETIKQIAKALLRVGAIDAQTAQRCVDQWQDEMDSAVRSYRE